MIGTRRRGARRSPPSYQRESIRDWQKGYISSQGANRTPQNGLRNALNLILSQDGTVKPRPSLFLYGSQPLGKVLGRPEEFIKRTGSLVENYLISVQVVGGLARVYVQKDGGPWTLCTGKNFDTTRECHFLPIRDTDANYNDEDKVLIQNGIDNLSYLDINTLKVIPFVALPAASAPTLTVGSGLTGTNFTHRYRVTASNRGETAASATTTASTSKIRESWSGPTEYIDVQINRVSGAERYHIYYGQTIGQEQYLFSIDDPGTGSTVTWRDTGTTSPDPFRTIPLGDTTAGPVCEDGAFINGQIYLVRDRFNPKYVRYGGTGNHLLDFSPYGGGGFQPVGGNKEFPVKVASFRDNSGNPATTILCTKKRYIFSPQTTTIGSTIISYFAVREENGADGTDAPDTVALIRNQLVYMSSQGAKTTFTKAQIQTILSTDSLTDLIQPDIDRLNTTSIMKANSVTYEDRWYTTLPAGSSQNNEIWVLDFSDLRKGAWMRPWNVQADYIWLYTDNSGETHFCAMTNNVISEFTYRYKTTDNGVTFPTGFSTGIMKFSEDGQEWANISRVTFVVESPLGSMTVAVNAKTEDNPNAPVGTEIRNYVPNSGISGWDEPLGWDMSEGWDQPVTLPEEFSLIRDEIEVEIDEDVKWLSCDFTTSGSVRFEITDIILEYINIGTKD